MFKTVLTAGALALAGLTAVPAAAASFTLTIGPGTGSTFFGNASSASGSIADMFSFTVPDGLVGGYVSTLSLTQALDVTLTSVLLDSTPFTKTTSGGFELFTLAPTAIGGGPHRISVAGLWGTSGGSYSGTLDFVAAIPEPASWALIIGGFGLTGITLRRRTAENAYAV